MGVTARHDPARDARPAVRALLTYMVATPEKPYVDTEALTGADQPRYHATLESREVIVHDGRPRVPQISLDREGFRLVRRPTAVEDLYDDEAVARDYYPEIESLVGEALGASRVVIFDHTRRVDDAARPGAKAPASRVHNDYTERSGPQRVREVMGEEAASRLAGRPVVQVNVWRPIRGPVRRSPLALLDAASLGPEDLIATDMMYPDRIGEIYHLAWNAGHRWFYFPEMERDEAVLIKGYDSRIDGRARFTPHTAFADPTTPPDAPARESIEVRTLAFL